MNRFVGHVQVYKHIYHGLGIHHSKGEVKYFCDKLIKGPYHVSHQNEKIIECLSSITTDLIDRDIPFTYYPPDDIKDGNISTTLLYKWWTIDASYIYKSDCPFKYSSLGASGLWTIENVNPYYIDPKTGRKRYLDYLPCFFIDDDFILSSAELFQ